MRRGMCRSCGEERDIVGKHMCVACITPEPDPECIYCGNPAMGRSGVCVGCAESVYVGDDEEIHASDVVANCISCGKRTMLDPRTGLHFYYCRTHKVGTGYEIPMTGRE